MFRLFTTLVTRVRGLLTKVSFVLESGSLIGLALVVLKQGRTLLGNGLAHSVLPFWRSMALTVRYLPFFLKLDCASLCLLISVLGLVLFLLTHGFSNAFYSGFVVTPFGVFGFMCLILVRRMGSSLTVCAVLSLAVEKLVFMWYWTARGVVSFGNVNRCVVQSLAWLAHGTISVHMVAHIASHIGLSDHCQVWRRCHSNAVVIHCMKYCAERFDFLLHGTGRRGLPTLLVSRSQKEPAVLRRLVVLVGLIVVRTSVRTVLFGLTPSSLASRECGRGSVWVEQF